MIPQYYLQKINSYISIHNLKNIKQNTQNLSHKYLNNNQTGAISKTTNDAISYLLARMPATYAACEFVLTKFKQMGKTATTCTDLGCGTGSTTIALKSILNPSKIYALEQQYNMIEAFNNIIDKDDSINLLQTNITTNFNSPNTDLIIASYVLNELNTKDQLKLTQQMYNKTNNYIIIIEPGTPKCFNDLQIIKQQLINLGAKIIAPCSGNNSCPIINTKDWCHFSTRLERSKLTMITKNCSLNYEDEKFCYIIASKCDNVTTNNVVLRHPIYKPKQVIVTLCQNNTLTTKTITKTSAEYKMARKLKVGDFYNNN